MQQNADETKGTNTGSPETEARTRPRRRSVAALSLVELLVREGYYRYFAPDGGASIIRDWPAGDGGIDITGELE